MKSNNEKYLEEQELVKYRLGKGWSYNDSGILVPPVKPTFHSFEEYLAAYPEAGKWKSYLATKKIEQNWFIPSINSTCWPGDYYNAKIFIWENKFHVHITDGDDFFVDKKCETLVQAEKELKQLEDLSPFDLFDLFDFGYKE